METCTIYFHNDEIIQEFIVPVGRALLDGSGAHSIPIGCRRGGCGYCKVKVLSGLYDKKIMSKAHINEEDLATGVVLACRILPQGDLHLELASTRAVHQPIF